MSRYGNYGKVSAAQQAGNANYMVTPAGGPPGASKYGDAADQAAAAAAAQDYATVGDKALAPPGLAPPAAVSTDSAKPKQNYLILPSPEEMYAMASAAAGGDDEAAKKAKKKQCQRCQMTKAASRVTIDNTPLKLCSACLNTVQAQPLEGRKLAKEVASGTSGPIAGGPCELCKSKPQHVRTQVKGSFMSVCASCMSQQPFFNELSLYGLSCVAHKSLEAAHESFEELLMLSPEHPATLYNMACVKALQKDPETSLTFLERALKAGYNNFKTIKKDSDLKAVRALKDFDPLMKRYQPKKKGLFRRSSSVRLEDSPPSSPSMPQRSAQFSGGYGNSGAPSTIGGNYQAASGLGQPGDYNSPAAVDYGKVSYDTVLPADGGELGGPPAVPTRGAPPSVPMRGAPPAVPSRGGAPAPGGRGPPPTPPRSGPAMVDGKAPLPSVGGQRAPPSQEPKDQEYRSLNDVKKVVYDAGIDVTPSSAPKEAKGPIVYDSSVEAITKAQQPSVVYDSGIDATNDQGPTDEDLAALQAMAAEMGDDSDDSVGPPPPPPPGGD